MSNDTLIKVTNVKKKFCRGLRKSLQYGVRDIAIDLVGRTADPKLRPQEFYAVDEVSFELQRGECLGLIGRNGAGKTTLLKMLNGLIKPDGGQITARGRVGALIALGAGFNPLLSGRENIYVNGSILGMRKAEISAKLESIIHFAELGEFIEAPVQSYSSGMVVRLGFAVAVHCQPNSLLLDEVLAVGDAAFQAKCFNALSEFRSRGVGFILVSHQLSKISYFCDRVLYLKKGRTAYLGNTEEGIAAFTQDMLLDSEALDDGSDGVCGNGKVAIKRVVFLDQMEKEITEIRAGDPVTLRLEYECATGEAVSSSVDISISDQSGTFFHDQNVVVCERLGGQGYIDVMFESMPANNQRLFFSICLNGPDSREMFDWKRRIPLTVHGAVSNLGRVYLAFHTRMVQQDKIVENAAE
jgi:homopolymeric O-antigen transport system ATP-binding protein